MFDVFLKIITDLQCNIYIDFELVGIAEKGLMKKVPLRKGEYIIKIESTLNSNYCHQETICLEYDKIIQIDFISEAKNHPEWSRDEDKICDVKTMALINRIDGKESELPYNYMEDFSDNIIIVRKDYKWGFINKNGKEIISCIYDNVKDLTDNLLCVKIDDKWGIIDKQCIQILPCLYNDIEIMDNDILLIKQDDKRGIINKYGKFILPAEYDYISICDGDYIEVRKEGKSGYISKHGETIIPLEYEELKNFDGNLVAARSGDKWGYIDKQCNIVIPFAFDYLGHFSGNLAVANIGRRYGFVDKRDYRSWDYEPKVRGCVCESIDNFIFRTNNQIAIDLNYTYAYDFSNDLAKVSYKGKEGVINSKDKTIIPVEYDEIVIEGQFIEVKNNDKWGLFNSEGDEILPCNYRWGFIFSENTICYSNGDKVFIFSILENKIIDEYDKTGTRFPTDTDPILSVKRNDKWGLINDQGTLIIPCTSSSELSWKKITDDTYRVKQDDKCCAIKSNGIIIAPPIYDYIDYPCFTHNGNEYVKIKNNKKEGILKKSGEVVISCQYDDVHNYNLVTIDILELIQEKYKHTYISICDNGEIKQYDYDILQIVELGISVIKKYDRCYIIDKHGKEIILPDYYEDYYDELENISFSEKFIKIKISDKWGILDNNFKEVLSPEYDDIQQIYLSKNMLYGGINQYNSIQIKIGTNLFRIKRNGQYSIYNMLTNTFYDGIYDEIDTVFDEFLFIRVSRNSKYGFINIHGEEIIPCMYDNIYNYDSFNNYYLAKIEKNNRIGFLDSFGREVIPCKYNYANKYEDYYGLIDLNLNGNVDGIEIAFNRINEMKSQYLFFDTETIGLPYDYSAPVTSVEKWPRVVQLSWCITNNLGYIIKSCDYIIYPEGFSIPEDSAKLHGITTNIAREKGCQIIDVLHEFIQDFKQCEYIVGHNIEFDKKVLGAELIRKNLPNIFKGEKQYICTMKESIELCSIPSWNGYKYPKLQELYQVLFDTSFDGAHNSLNDVHATIKCFWEMVKRKIIQPQGYIYY